ncbi:MAG: DNA-binding protein [Gammaproteobacteria bacterium CG11_big_fil_rev_8_21_14_0_20_46_22]|nr:MAG: DNA-binding protein [Gammaproteobacteria bacterium CG11_big_fil_rev_8_21_14_0_20_46_22]
MNHESHLHTLNEKEAAKYIGMSVSYLQHDRCYGFGDTRGPVYVKLGRSVRYLRSDLDDWILKQRVDRIN